MVAEGDRVRSGDALIAFDLDLVGRRAKSLITPVVVTNGEAFGVSAPLVDRLLTSGETLFDLYPIEPGHGVTGTMGSMIERSLVVPLRHGLHARPAARIAELARGFDARVELVTDDGRQASALSPVAILALALPHGASIRLRGQGTEAE